MSETIGQKLRSSREEKRLSLEQASAATRVRLHYLEALEGDDLSAIPSTAQARGFLRIYADFLGLNADEFVPVARPSEPQPVVPSQSETNLPKAGPSTAPAQEPTPGPTVRPNLLTSLRERFARRSNTENVIAESGHEQEQPAVHEPEFIPARYTEELPAEPEPGLVEESTKPEKLSPGKKTASSRKPAVKKAKTSSRAKAGKKSEVKKKLMKTSRPKRGSSSRKRSSSPTNRVPKKSSNRKPKKRA